MVPISCPNVQRSDKSWEMRSIFFASTPVLAIENGRFEPAGCKIFSAARNDDTLCEESARVPLTSFLTFELVITSRHASGVRQTVFPTDVEPRASPCSAETVDPPRRERQKSEMVTAAS